MAINSAFNKQGLDITKMLKSTGLVLIGMLSLGYLIFWRMFAEIHISVFNLGFPVFIGEIFMAVLCILWLAIYGFQRHDHSIWIYPFLLYFLIIVIKAIYGYFTWGQLALRHAALFYYPLFAVFAYTFYSKSFFSSRKNRLLLFFLFLFIFIFVVYRNYYSLTCIMLCFMIAGSFPRGMTRYLFFGLLLIFAPSSHLFYTSRSFFIANLSALIFIAFALLLMLKIPRSFKAALIPLFAAFIAIGFLKISHKEGIESLFNFEKIREVYRKYNKEVLEKRDDFKMEKLPIIRLYNPESESSYFYYPPQPAPPPVEPAKADESAKIPESAKEVKAAAIKIPAVKAPEPAAGVQPTVLPLVVASPPSAPAQVIEPPASQSIKNQIVNMIGWNDVFNKDKLKNPSVKRGELVEYHNILFRFFIWRDLLTELKDERAIIFGFAFGKPFRSKSIEILNWAGSEWRRDGWISIHNGFLDIIYRAGLMGVTFIIFLAVIAFKMIYSAVHYELVSAVLLCGILLNWIVAANFLEILELPYYAIPFWSLLGMTMAYLRSHTNKTAG